MTKYELESVQLPQLTGWGLRTFAKSLDNGMMRGLLLPKLFRDAGIYTLRQLRLEEAPTFQPIAFPPDTTGPHPSPHALLQFLEEKAAPQPEGLPFHTVRDYAKAYRSGHTTPDEIAKKVIDAIQQDAQATPTLQAFIASEPADILAQAAQSTKRLAAGEALSMLDGVPVAIKDEIHQLPYPTTVGTAFMKEVPAEDSTAVARLRAAGALLIGKVNMHEIGINPNSCNLHHGSVRNPYGLEHEAGGSSSGSAAVVAANFCPVAIGADGGGSIRIPAAHCGIVGLKPTYGRISEHGAAPLCWSVAHLGPMTATAEDAAITYALIAGPDPKDPNTLHQPPVSLEGWGDPNLKGLTLGIYPSWFQHATPELVEACETMLRSYEKDGATIKEIEVPELNEMRIAHSATILSEMAASMENYAEHWKSFSPTVRVNLTFGKLLSSFDYIQSQRMRTRAMEIFARLYKEVDVIVTPASAIPAPALPKGHETSGWSDLSSAIEVMRYIIPGNFVGLPAISFPVGYHPQGLPLSMQLMAKHWNEALLLRMAHHAEQYVQRQPPQRHYPIL